MTDDLVYIPNDDDAGFLSLSSAPASYSRPVRGKLFKKHILSTGPLYYKGLRGGKVDVDEAFMHQMVSNFENKVRPIVQVPIVDENNSHTEDPLRNVGEVVGLSVENGKLYSIIDVRDDVVAPKFGKTLLGASAMLNLNAIDNRTGKPAGPTVIHVAVTNNPHVNELDGFEEVLLSSSDDSSSQAVMLSTTPETLEEATMDLDTLIATLRDEHNIDVPALQRAAAEAEGFAKLSETLQETLTGSQVLKLSSDEGSAPSAEDIVAAVTALAEERIELSSKVDTLVEESRTAKAEARVDALISDGFILPAKRDVNIKLLLSDADTFEEFLPEKPIVELSAKEHGKDLKDEEQETVVESEIARLSQLAKDQGLNVSV